MAFGIPPLLNQASQAVANVQLLVADAASVLGLLGTQQWGLYADGELVIEPDSIFSVEVRQDYRVVDYPMEQGAFESYNKVTTPFDTKVRMTKGGSLSDRQDFLDAVIEVSKSLDLYDVVTPEHSYIGMNVVHYDYRREARHGVSLITVDLWLMEVRDTVVPVYTATVNDAAPTAPVTSPAKPSGADPVNTGTVQPQTPTSAVKSAVQTRVDQLNAVIARSTPRIP